MRGRRQDGAWRHFEAWCRTRRLRPLPAHPWTVAAYARWCERRQGYPAIVRRLDEIARVHLLKRLKPPVRHPTVTRTLRMIERRRGGHAAALFRDEDFTATASPPEPPQPQEPQEPQEPPSDVSGGATKAMRSTPRLVLRRPAAR
ncbi:MAG: hypothetical protein QGI63_05430 [Rhodospirillales bacterium]|jgi:hypothetical protein|nr:hypothetical protein [Rhodospirillales bacterium]MDP6773693.1 hypothetical protein [Rhodospirillales bacterium]